ncbi:MAG: hypothetical protein ACRDS1_02865 [Pseudonocardiaceae bacterium]
MRDPAEPGIRPLGRPIADSQVWVQRRDDQFAGVGEVGEIVIRTARRAPRRATAMTMTTSSTRNTDFRSGLGY